MESSSINVDLFPNPATSTINIISPETISSIEIENVLGQVVKRMNVNDNNAVCDVEDLPSGVYVANIRTMHGECITEIKLKFMKE